MNLILFESNHSEISLPATDPRAKHITGVLRRRVGDVFDAGVINGARGKGTVQNVSDGALELTFAWGAEPRSADPITLVVGLPRPQTARRILQETTSLGVERMYFARTKRGEASYGSSKLWSTGEWRRHLIAGAEQAFTTRLPEVSWGEELSSVIESLRDKTCRIALDNYESPESIAEANLESPIVIAIGPERGWSPEERVQLRAGRFAFAHLGSRPLRVDTACLAAIAVVQSQLGLIELE